MEAPLPSFRLVQRKPAAKAASKARPAPGSDAVQPPTKYPRSSSASDTAELQQKLLAQVDRIRSCIEAIDSLPPTAPPRHLPFLSRRSSTSSTSAGSRLSVSRTSTLPSKAQVSNKGPNLPIEDKPTPKRGQREAPLPNIPKRSPEAGTAGEAVKRSRWDQPSHPRREGKGERELDRLKSGSSNASSRTVTGLKLGEQQNATPSPARRRASPLPSVPLRPTAVGSKSSPGLTTRTSPSKSFKVISAAPLRWTGPGYCETQFNLYRRVAYKLKKRADEMMQTAGGAQGKQFETAQVMLTDSLLLYAYGSWARDQRLRFGDGAASTPSEGGENHDIGLPNSLGRSTCPRGVKDWMELKPLIEHVTYQLRKVPTPRMMALEALLQTLHARITLLCSAYTQGSVSRKITLMTRGREEHGLTLDPDDLVQFASQLSSSLKDTDGSWARGNQARASFHPLSLQTDFPNTWSAVGSLPADQKVASDKALGLDPSSLNQIRQMTGFSVDRPAPVDPSGPVFPFPDGADALAHLVVLGRMLVAEAVYREGLDYDLVSVSVNPA